MIDMPAEVVVLLWFSCCTSLTLGTPFIRTMCLHCSMWSYFIEESSHP